MQGKERKENHASKKYPTDFNASSTKSKRIFWAENKSYRSHFRLGIPTPERFSKFESLCKQNMTVGFHELQENQL